MNSGFKIKLQGDKSEINIDLLVSQLTNTTTIIQEINRNLDSGKKIEIKIKALEKGSFLIDICLIETALESLKNILTSDNIKTGSIIISSLVGLLTLKKHLKGQEPKETKPVEGNKISITNNSGNVIIVDNMAFDLHKHNDLINSAIAKQFKELDNSQEIKGIEFTDNVGEKLIEIQKNEFDNLIIKKAEIIDGIKRCVISATLNILRMSFDEKLKSDFYYRGIKISAAIKDNSFFDKINKGEAFSKGDALEVEMEIKQKFDESVDTYINHSYKITKIVQHIKRGQQQKLF